MALFTYKSFCWSFGTTSFRTKNFNKTIEEQLKLIKEFWSLPGMDESNWDDSIIQEKYYDFLIEKSFVAGSANRKDKDAREKTSGLVDIGIINAERLITNAGENLLKVTDENDYSLVSILHIPKDSFIYFKQLLKFGVGIDGKYIRPFIVILYALCKLKYLTYEEFTYLIPLCVDKDTTKNIIEKIQSDRNSNLNIDNIIIDTLLTRDNYSPALKYFLDNIVSKEVICEVGMNRKSRNYDLVYYDLFKLLRDKYINNIGGG